MQYSRIDFPISGIDFSPAIIGPQSISIISFMRLVKLLLDETLIVGQIGFPVGVPNHVVNNIKVAPLAVLPVVASTSFPGVQTKFKPGFVTCSE